MPFQPSPGDFGLGKGGGALMRAVRIGTASRYGHACIAEAVGTDGRIGIIEPMPTGCRRRAARAGEFVWSDVPLSAEKRTAVVAYAATCVGLPYDWPAIAGFVLRHWRARLGGQPDDKRGGAKLICSELPVRAYRIVGVDMFPGRAAGSVSPGDLRQWLDDQRRATPNPAAPPPDGGR